MTTSPDMTAPATTVEPPDAILAAAFEAFAAYGFKRTSMEDIAGIAGMSRSALYLRYRNKEDILRTLARTCLDQGLDDMAAVLARPGLSIEQALLDGLIAKDGVYMQAVLGTPHGAEIVDEGLAATKDIVEDIEARLRTILTEWLQRQTLPDGVGTPAEVADTIVTAVHGLKLTSRSFAAYREGERRLARIYGRALSISP